MSMVSICGGPPSRWMLMIALWEDPIPVAFSARSRLANVSPPKPAAPAERNWRRGTPSQCRIDRSQNVNMIHSLSCFARIPEQY